MNQQTLTNKIKQTFENSNVITAKNTELYKLFGVKDTDNPYEVVKNLNDYLYNTVKDGYSNGIYMPTLAAYLFFKRNRKDLLDNLAVYKTAAKPYISIKKQIPEGYTTLQKWMARIMQLYGKHLQANSFKKVKQLNLITTNKELEEYLGYFLILEDLQNITIFGDYDNPSTSLKNLVVFKDLEDGIGALLYKVVKDNIGIKEALMGTNFVVLNNKQNILNKLDDIVLYANLSNARNIVVSENISPEITIKLQEKIEDFYEGIGEKVPEMFKLSKFDFVREAKRLIKIKDKDVKNKGDVGLSIA